LLPRGESGYFSSKSYVDNTFSTVQITGSSTILVPNFTGGGTVSVSVLGNIVTIFGSASTGAQNNSSTGGVTGISINSGASITGRVDFQSLGTVSVSLSGNTIIYSGNGLTGGAISGETYKSSIYVESPTSSENINWYYNAQPIILRRVLTSYTGPSGAALGWTIYQTTDASATGTLIITGRTDSYTTGNYLTGFSNPNLSGNVFVVLRTQSLSGTVSGVNISLVGDNLLQIANPYFNTGLYVTGATNIGTGSGLLSGSNNTGLMSFYSLAPGSGMTITQTPGTYVIHSTHGQSTGFAATGGSLLNAHQYYHVISGDMGAGTWFGAANIYLTTPPNQLVRVTSKLWDGNATIYTAHECSVFASGVSTTGTTGHLTINLMDLIRTTGISTPIVVSCAASLTGCIVKTLPMDYATGIGANVTSDLDLLKLI
jgi:hypothetical protein